MNVKRKKSGITAMLFMLTVSVFFSSCCGVFSEAFDALDSVTPESMKYATPQDEDQPNPNGLKEWIDNIVGGYDITFNNTEYTPPIRSVAPSGRVYPVTLVTVPVRYNVSWNGTYVPDTPPSSGGGGSSGGGSGKFWFYDNETKQFYDKAEGGNPGVPDWSTDHHGGIHTSGDSRSAAAVPRATVYTRVEEKAPAAQQPPGLNNVVYAVFDGGVPQLGGSPACYRTTDTSFLQTKTVSAYADWLQSNPGISQEQGQRQFEAIAKAIYAKYGYNYPDQYVVDYKSSKALYKFSGADEGLTVYPIRLLGIDIGKIDGKSLNEVAAGLAGSKCYVMLDDTAGELDGNSCINAHLLLDDKLNDEGKIDTVNSVGYLTILAGYAKYLPSPEFDSDWMAAYDFASRTYEKIEAARQKREQEKAK